MAALRLRLQKEMFDVTEEQLLALAHVTNSQVGTLEYFLNCTKISGCMGVHLICRSFVHIGLGWVGVNYGYWIIVN